MLLNSENYVRYYGAMIKNTACTSMNELVSHLLAGKIHGSS